QRKTLGMALWQTTATPITAATMIARRISAGNKQQEQLPAIPRVWDLCIIVSHAICLSWDSSRLLQSQLVFSLIIQASRSQSHHRFQSRRFYLLDRLLPGSARVSRATPVRLGLCASRASELCFLPFRITSVSC